MSKSEIRKSDVFSRLAKLSSEDLAILVGGDDYLDWCEAIFNALVSQSQYKAAGVSVIPQLGKDGGIRTSRVFKLDLPSNYLNIDTDILDDFWDSPKCNSYKVSLEELMILEGHECVIAPISIWFDNPIGLFWSICESSCIEDVSSRISYAALLVSQSVMINKGGHVLKLLAEPVWLQEYTTKRTATAVAQSCLEALSCKAVIIWECDHNHNKHLLKTLASCGNIRGGLAVDMRIGQGAAGLSAMNNCIVTINDFSDEAELLEQGIKVKHERIVETRGWKSAIFVPFDIGDRIAGVLGVYAGRTYAFTQLDQDVAMAFAQRLAAGYANVSRMKELIDMEERLYKEAAAIESGLLAMEYIHDAYNSLGIAQAYTGNVKILSKASQNNKIYEYSSVISENVDSALKILQNVRDSADISKTKFSRNKLRKTLEEVVIDLQGKINDRGISMKINCPDIKIFYDKKQMQRVFKNLFENSIYFLEGIHRRKPQIAVKVEVLDSSVIIKVKDNGCGINNSNLDKIFDYLYTTKGDRGMGFGLAISKRIVEKNHNGKLSVTSKWGEETEFTIELPRRKEQKDI